jgi:4'-phosphopantetheinyl transferase
VRTLAPTSWPPPAVPPLDPGAVEVFSIGLDEARVAPTVLSPDERERADRFATDQLSRRWSRARAALRQVLAAYADEDPAALVLEPAPCVHCGEPHGKPRLATPDLSWLRFNISHSGELAMVAVAHGREVGVDVELTREGRRLEGIAERFFDEAETAELRRLPGAERQASFYRLWARKEAYLKATAEGIAKGLASVNMLDLESRPGWELADLSVPPGYAGALAVAPPGFSPTGPAGDERRSR